MCVFAHRVRPFGTQTQRQMRFLLPSEVIANSIPGDVTITDNGMANLGFVALTDVGLLALFHGDPAFIGFSGTDVSKLMS